MDRSMVSAAAMLVTVVVLLGGACTVDAYTLGSSSLSRSTAGKIRYSPAAGKRTSIRSIHRRREDGSDVTLYLFPSQASVSAAHTRRQRPRGHDSRSGSRTTSLPMSASVLAESDILPSFQTAHGLLSPEVVTRIGDMNDVEEGGPLHQFLKTYKREGPMACLPMLSDPCMLPELTRAMRGIH
eukprot:CAMPEP_0172529546 /NCGR_PEP_ID=MMETSP1067-20121228/3606_1 /TAXON_ID=265564 ORGANISM="Thalassiosira punctigera, Strain Tpunct2005C2" /NCGR_SAMPLE_ID=MMETSP1067 /ASSEMBLY_ACC=CAM_ASM_000444 /LENGTH=182 /DNA_ID=CAMNT_0013313617 /DNA_START=32 /DNA_END=580 /DNA_ORIENTATION=+